MPGPTPGPIFGIRRRMPFAGGPGRYPTVTQKSASAAIIFSASGAGAIFHARVSGSASLILSALAVETATTSALNTAEIIFAPLAHRIGMGSAEIIFSAAATETAIFDDFLTRTPLAALFFTANAGATATHAQSGELTLRLTASASAGGGILTADRLAGASILFRCRADVPGLLPFGIEDYLGRFQQGQELPLQLQCFASGETPGLPDNPPVVRIYGDGTLVDEAILAVQPDTQVAGRFGLNYRLGARVAPGRYVAAYWYSAMAMIQSQVQVFEVVPGGDPGGPTIAAQLVSRPDGDQILAQLGSGPLVLGRDPYLDEGV